MHSLKSSYLSLWRKRASGMPVRRLNVLPQASGENAAVCSRFLAGRVAFARLLGIHFNQATDLRLSLPSTPPDFHLGTGRIGAPVFCTTSSTRIYTVSVLR
jgi:hypothetical protein